MSPIVAWLKHFSYFTAGLAVWGLFLAGAVIYLIAEWRIRVLALFAQYFFLALLFTRLFADRPELALLKMLVGWLICGALYFSARVRQDAVDGHSHFHWAADLPFRAFSLATFTLVAYLASQHYALPFIPENLALACFLLTVLALLFIGTDEDVVVVGVGVLNLLAALDMFYSSQDPGLLVTGLLVMLNLLVGLAVSYLAVVEVPE